MKKTLIAPIGGFILVSLLLCGCASTETIKPAQPAITNAVTGEVTPAVPAVVGYVPNKTVTTIVEDGKAITPFLPPPYREVAETALGLATLISGFFWRVKTKQVRTKQAVIASIIQGVEAAGNAATVVKEAIAATAAANGNGDHVEAEVNKIVGSQ